MAFGPELLVVRDEHVEGKADEVRLGEFDPDQFPLLPANDPMLRFVDSVLAGFLKRRDSASRFLNGRISDRNSILWGVIEEDQPVGFASLSLEDQDRTFCTYTIVLHPSARNKGLGGLATAGVVQTGLKDFALHNVSVWFDGYMSGIGTAIDPENRVSQIMCQRAGFELVEGEYHYINRANFLSYLCTEPGQQPITVLTG